MYSSYGLITRRTAAAGERRDAAAAAEGVLEAAGEARKGRGAA